jgi:arylsulfatase
VKDGKPVYVYNYLGLDHYKVTADTALPEGKSTVKMEFAYDGQPKLGAGGTATLFIDGKKVGSTRVEKTQFAIWSADETANVGIDRETSVSSDYTEETSQFTGKIGKITITVK